MSVILIGFKGCGKTTIGRELAKKLKKEFVDLDEVIEGDYYKRQNEKLSVREIYRALGDKNFRKFESKALEKALQGDRVIALGGGTVESEKNRKLLWGKRIIHIRINKEQLYNQVMKRGMPAIFDKADPRGSFEALLAKREPLYEEIADISADLSGLSPEGAANMIKERMER